MNDVLFFFSGWQPLGRILVVGALMYVTLVIFLRLSGSRTLASMSAFDFIVTVAIGSAFGRALTAKGVALAEAVTAFASQRGGSSLDGGDIVLFCADCETIYQVEELHITI